MSLCDVEDDDGRGVLVRVARDLDDRVAFAGDDVRRGDDEIAPREPAAPLDSDAARRAEHLDDARERTSGCVDCEERRPTAGASAPTGR